MNKSSNMLNDVMLDQFFFFFKDCKRFQLKLFTSITRVLKFPAQSAAALPV